MQSEFFFKKFTPKRSVSVAKRGKKENKPDVIAAIIEIVC